MPTLENTIVIMIIAYIATFIYSIFMAILNWRQAKVKDILMETNIKLDEQKSLSLTTNEILERIERKLK